MKQRNKQFIIIFILILPLLLMGVLAMPAQFAAANNTPDDWAISKQLWYYQMTNIDEAWQQTTGDEDIVVAVIDDGIDMQHPDLKEQLWTNWDEIPTNDIDDDNNGYVDDRFGYDFSYSEDRSGPIRKTTYLPGTFDTEFLKSINELLDVYYDADFYDLTTEWKRRVLREFYINHGTPVASIIGSEANNRIYTAGTMHNVQIMNVPIFELWKVNEKVVASVPPAGELKIANAIRYATDNGADVINLSFGVEGGPDKYQYMGSALKYARSNGVVVIAAAGNDSEDTSDNPTMPACSKHTLTIGAVDSNKYRTDFTNYGECVDMYAPGESMASLFYGVDWDEKNQEIFDTRIHIKESGTRSRVQNIDGTSFSAPLVSGIAGLLLSKYPNATPEDVYSRLEQTADTHLMRPYKGGYIVNANNALNFGPLGEPTEEKEGEVLGESTVNTDHIPNGALIRAEGSDDVYIVKYVGAKKFKRLVLSPSVFNSYGHLHWDDIMVVSPDVADAFETSDLVRATVAGDPRVYKLYPQGDTGEKRLITSADVFNAHGWDWDAIYTINETDRDSYIEGDPFYQ